METYQNGWIFVGLLAGTKTWVERIPQAIANVIDAIMTVLWVGLGVREANPLFAQLVYQPVVFVIAKILLVSSGVLVLHQYRDRILAKYGGRFAALCYAVLLLWHAIGAVIVMTH